MKVSNSDTNFSGRLILKHPKQWTDGMLSAIKNNASIQNKLLDYDVVGNLSRKIERRNTASNVIHMKGDKIYKLNFIVRKEDLSFIEKIKDFFGLIGRKYNVNRHFHSEITTIARINKLNMK